MTSTPHPERRSTGDAGDEPDAEDQAQATPDLHAEIRRGQRLDRDLARDLGHPEPVRSTDAGGYVESLAHRPVLPRATERDLVEAAQAGDAAAKGQLIEACMPLIAAAARTYRTGQVHRAELLQEGVVGVLRALERYDPERGIPFWGYATWWVRQAMQQLVSELTRPVVLSDRALRHLACLKDVHHQAVQLTGREPSRAELAERSGLSPQQVDDLLATERGPRSVEESLVGSDGDVGAFGDLLVDPIAEDAYERVLDMIEVQELHALLAGLSDRERDVLRARYGLDTSRELSLREIGHRLGLSHERIRQIEQRALAKLRAAILSTPGTRDDSTATARIFDEPQAQPDTDARRRRRRT